MHRPIRQPRFGSGLRPQDSAGFWSHICSHAPFTQRPIRQPSSGSGLSPQLADCADTSVVGVIEPMPTITSAINNRSNVIIFSHGKLLYQSRQASNIWPSVIESIS